MKQKTKYQEIIVPATGRKSWMGGAYTLTFIYAPEGNFLIKGYMAEVEEYIKGRFKRCLMRHVLYRERENRTILHFSDSCNLFIETPSLRKRNYSPRYTVRPYGYYENPDASTFKFKRLPQYWLKEYDYLIDHFSKKI